MSSGFETDAEPPVTEQDEATAQLEELMGQSDSGDVVDLDEAALRAASELAEVEDLDLEPFDEPPPEPEFDVVHAAPVPGRRRKLTDRLLQGLLLLNVAMLGVMLAITGSADPGPAEKKVEKKRRDPFIEPTRQLPLPTSALWESSVRAAGRGDYARAVELLEHHLRTSADMTDLERQLVYNQLALYLVKDGRLSESQEYSLKFQQLMSRSYLPEDLLESAKQAADKEMFAEMRRAYARFLLQIKQASPAMRKLEAEAYLKLGDSYRLEAERAAKQAEQQSVEKALRRRGKARDDGSPEGTKVNKSGENPGKGERDG